MVFISFKVDKQLNHVNVYKNKIVMKRVTSAGLLMYNFVKGELKVFLVHPGGPYHRNKDLWDVPKGKVEDGENILAGAKREFEEETGKKPTGPYFYLGNVLTKSKTKKVHIWIFKGTHTGPITSNNFSIIWPPKSGKMQEFPEIEKGEWFSVEQAKKKIYPYQKSLLNDIEEFITKNILKR